eukprot:CAMPEP_0183305102 /NCGR_PEP_ID=MMETSP0160_2-20130417/9957_1 /TAXON_ID=2839 ORGANISM="Odontella Sinensis, Strain Grunow 1884" /NCGR_SAMPLE_ID=MMETSP0160_2 /ASSEMBLY_ACC=CAM_ASM_000250 /LENGTH=74 /DNA_ID=CAMNT_0025468255 /DNA_START=59 /DNA_END=279 /DNA_ORIENTATION=+
MTRSGGGYQDVSDGDPVRLGDDDDREISSDPVEHFGADDDDDDLDDNDFGLDLSQDVLDRAFRRYRNRRRKFAA